MRVSRLSLTSCHEPANGYLLDTNILQLIYGA
jgi:hypothetical protein